MDGYSKGERDIVRYVPPRRRKKDRMSEKTWDEIEKETEAKAATRIPVSICSLKASHGALLDARESGERSWIMSDCIELAKMIDGLNDIEKNITRIQRDRTALLEAIKVVYDGSLSELSQYCIDHKIAYSECYLEPAYRIVILKAAIELAEKP